MQVRLRLSVSIEMRTYNMSKLLMILLLLKIGAGGASCAAPASAWTAAGSGRQDLAEDGREFSLPVYRREGRHEDLQEQEGASARPALQGPRLLSRRRIGNALRLGAVECFLYCELRRLQRLVLNTQILVYWDLVRVFSSRNVHNWIHPVPKNNNPSNNSWYPGRIPQRTSAREYMYYRYIYIYIGRSFTPDSAVAISAGNVLWFIREYFGHTE